jgi:50S ribosomal protein L16 3-hydroxylase
VIIAQSGMQIDQPTPLLGGLTPATFMRRHWQKKPLLIRAAVVEAAALVRREELFALAARDDVESRLVRCQGERWSLRPGPLARLPSPKTPGWTLLVQGADLHLAAAHELLQRFRFVPDARLDDAMLSYASDGGGVGPHVDSYDVFLLQLQGRRRWRIARSADLETRDDVPLKMLARFTPQNEWLLEPGDMLYLPPGWGHDGVAEGECITCSIGFRAPAGHALADEVLQRMLEEAEAPEADPRYRDPSQPATSEPGRVPAALQEFTAAALQRLVADRRSLARALGEVLSEPKPGVVFESEAEPKLPAQDALQLDRRSRMLYDDWHVFINGDAYRAGGRDARLMRRLADRRQLLARDIAMLSEEARELLRQWHEAGWLTL